VIVIIGLFVGLLLPVMGRAREGARRAMCANNLRQHGVAWYLYLDEHNECFPKYASSTDDTACIEITFGGKAGHELTYPADTRPLNRYLDVTDTSAEIFHCPCDTKPMDTYTETAFDSFGDSYFFNLLILQFGSPPPYTNRPLSTITSPPDKVYLEICHPMLIPGHGGRGTDGSRTPVMVLFLDGHVKGCYLYSDEWDITPTGQHPERPVYLFPNTTPNPFD